MVYILKNMNLFDMSPFKEKNDAFKRLLDVANLNAMTSHERAVYDENLKIYRGWRNTLEYMKSQFQFVMVDNMEWFNVFGLIFIAVIMIPNVVFAIKCKDGFDNKWNNVEVTEQVGRLCCFGFMIINIPGTWFGWWSDEAFALYLIVDTILVMLYCAIWIICFKKNSVFRALTLSIIPSMLFLFSGIMSRSVLLIIASVLFAPSHIVISYKNVK